MDCYKVWVLGKPSAHNEHGLFDCEHIGDLAECVRYVQDITPMFGWVISDARNVAVCSGEIPVAWEASQLS